MAALISFRTSRFDPATERPNPINPIAGESVLVWIRENVLSSTDRATEPDVEDWGWYIDVEAGDSRYLVGACGESDEDERSAQSEREWMVQIHKVRSFKEKLLGRNKMKSDDPFVLALVAAFRSDEAFTDVQVDADA